MPLDREKARQALLDLGVFDDGWNVSQPTVTEVLDAIEPYVTPRLAEVDARIVSDAEAKLARIRAIHYRQTLTLNNGSDHTYQQDTCAECGGPDEPWPCATAQILDGQA